MQTTTIDSAATHRAILNGSELYFNAALETSGNDIEAWIAKVGGDRATLKVEVLAKEGLSPSLLTQVQQPVINKLHVGQYDQQGDARSQRDREAAVAAGFVVRNPVYRQGLRATGMQQHRAAFEALPTAKDAARALIARITVECRRDVEIEKTDVRMNAGGFLVAGDDRLAFNGRSFAALCNRLGMPAGASTYLPAIEPELRATNVNRWVVGPLANAEQLERQAAVIQKKAYEADVLKVRTRLADPDAGPGTARECFAVVSDSYGTFDTDQIAKAIELAVPEGARAEVDYDGQRCKFNVTFFSNLPVEQAVAGEFFQAGVSIRTDDTGGGSIVVSAAIRQNLCLNFIILDNAEQSERIRHLGSTEKLAAKFKAAFAKALKRIEHFTTTWGYAVADDVVPEALANAIANQDIEQDDATKWIGMPAREVLAGLFNGLIERELVPLPKRNRTETIDKLLTMYDADDSSACKLSNAIVSRAAVVNAITRYAHEVNRDGFKEAELETAGGALLQSTKPLPFLPLPV